MSDLSLRRKESSLFGTAALNLLRDTFGYASNLFLIARFVAGPAGQSHGISRVRKVKLAAKIMLNYRNINSLSPWQHHLLMVQEVLKVPPEVKGDVVEYG